MKFSVLASVYIKETPNNLAVALGSVFQQTVLPNEVVLVEDGPLTGELYHVINEFEERYPNIIKRVPLSENKGLGNALRIGVDACKYSIIARMDTDDFSRANRFEKQIKFLEENPGIGAIGSNIEEFNKVPGDLRRYKVNPETHDALIANITLRSPFNHPSMMIRKEALMLGGNYNGDILLFEDYSLFLRMWLAGVKFYNMQEVLLDFRVGSGIETIKRRSGKHYIQKEKKFLEYAKSIGAFSQFEIIKYKLIKFPIRIMPPKIVLFIYNTFLRK